MNEQLHRAGYEAAQADLAIFGESFIQPGPSAYKKGYELGVAAFKEGIVKYPYLAQLPWTL
jgi:hypothetical protein